MRQKSYRTALGGILSALSITFMFLGGVFPFAEYVGPAMASICVLIFKEEFGAKAALLMYIAVSLLAILLSPSLESSLLFMAFMGWYPISKNIIETKAKSVLSMMIKLLLVNISVLSLYYVLLNVLKLPSLEEDLAGGPWLTAVLIILYNITFLLFDRLLTVISYYYKNVFRKKLIR
ncbi:MAG: hypothetical protein IKG47_12170 [Oscillospiraceae bacterium]|nr:hypothetical protein [Oscillospiraceae bacterium]